MYIHTFDRDMNFTTSSSCCSSPSLLMKSSTVSFLHNISLLLLVGLKEILMLADVFIGGNFNRMPV